MMFKLLFLKKLYDLSDEALIMNGGTPNGVVYSVKKGLPASVFWSFGALHAVNAKAAPAISTNLFIGINIF